jgi:hypothetical protein
MTEPCRWREQISPNVDKYFPAYKVSFRVSQWMTVWASSHSPVDWDWPIVVRPLLLSKRRPHFKTRKSLKRTQIWSRVPKQTLNVLARASSNLQLVLGVTSLKTVILITVMRTSNHTLFHIVNCLYPTPVFDFWVSWGATSTTKIRSFGKYLWWILSFNYCNLYSKASRSNA